MHLIALRCNWSLAHCQNSGNIQVVAFPRGYRKVQPSKLVPQARSLLRGAEFLRADDFAGCLGLQVPDLADPLSRPFSGLVRATSRPHAWLLETPRDQC